MKRVLMLSDSASLQDLNNRSNLNLLISMGCEIHVGCNFISGNTTSPERVDAFLDELEDAGIRCHQLSFVPSLNPMEKQPDAEAEVRFLIKKYKYDLIHCLTLSALQCAGPAAQKYKIPVMATTFGLPVHKRTPLYRRMYFMPKLRKAAGYADVLVCCNSEDHQLAQKRLPAKNTVYIPGTGLDPYRFRAPEIDRYRMRDLMEMPQNAVTLISMGPLTAEKNHQVIIKALAKLKRLDINYLICGGGPEADNLYQLISRLHLEDRVHFARNRDDVASVLHSCDIFCLPSKSEGIGMPALEAMEAGLPLITSDVQGIKDFMVNGETGFMFSPNDVNGFVSGIEALVEDKKLRLDMGDHNRVAAEKFYRGNTDSIMKKLYEAQLSEQPERKAVKVSVRKSAPAAQPDVPAPKKKAKAAKKASEKKIK